MGARIRQLEAGLRKFRARRAPCLWQGAADLMAFGLLPPGPNNLTGKWGFGGSVVKRLEAGKWRLEAGKWRLEAGK